MNDTEKGMIESSPERQLGNISELAYRQGQMDAVYQLVALLRFMTNSQKKPLTIEFILEMRDELIDLWARKAKAGV